MPASVPAAAPASAPASAPPSNTPIVEVRGLRKTYRNASRAQSSLLGLPRLRQRSKARSAEHGAKVAVADVSFEIRPGEIFGILGTNGAGKSTTVECLAGLRTPDDGTIRVLGVDPQGRPEVIRQHVGVQFQESALHDKITVREALRLFASYYDEPADVDQLLTLLSLAKHQDKHFAALSGGLKQRVSIALALIGRPKIAILDELTTALDPAARRQTWELIKRVRDAGVTVLLVTHFMDEAEYLCDRLVIIDAGAVVAAGTPRELTSALGEGASLEDVFLAHTGFAYDVGTGVGADAADLDDLDDVA